MDSKNDNPIAADEIVREGKVKPVIEYHINTFPANDPTEDAHSELFLDNGSLFGIYDGHSGTAAAHFLKENMLQYVKNELSQVKIQPKITNNDISLISRALQNAFLQADKDFLEKKYCCTKL